MCVKTNVVSEMVPNMADTMKKKITHFIYY